MDKNLNVIEISQQNYVIGLPSQKWPQFCKFDMPKRKNRDVSTGRDWCDRSHPKFSDTLTLFQPRGADSAHHWRGHAYIFPVVTSLRISMGLIYTLTLQIHKTEAINMGLLCWYNTNIYLAGRTLHTITVQRIMHLFF